MDLLLKSQKNEITEYHIYSQLANRIKENRNKKLLKQIADDELKHYGMFKKHTKQDIKPSWFKIKIYYLMALLLGLSFTLKFMENNEKNAIKTYQDIPSELKRHIVKDESRHEHELLNLISERKIEYAGSIVLRLNDALVELTGALAGLTFALRNGKMIAMIGFITGFAASLSMAASEYLSSKEEEGDSTKSPLRASIYTGITYLITVFILISPFFLLNNVYLALGIMLTITITIVALYTFYITTAKNQKFWKRFAEMALISLGVAIISFGIGLLVRKYFGVDV